MRLLDHHRNNDDVGTLDNVRDNKHNSQSVLMYLAQKPDLWKIYGRDILIQKACDPFLDDERKT
jgi:hypothetical protein